MCSRCWINWHDGSYQSQSRGTESEERTFPRQVGWDDQVTTNQFSIYDILPGEFAAYDDVPGTSFGRGFREEPGGWSTSYFETEMLTGVWSIHPEKRSTRILSRWSGNKFLITGFGEWLTISRSSWFNGLMKCIKGKTKNCFSQPAVAPSGRFAVFATLIARHSKDKFVLEDSWSFAKALTTPFACVSLVCVLSSLADVRQNCQHLQKDRMSGFIATWAIKPRFHIQYQ